METKTINSKMSGTKTQTEDQTQLTIPQENSFPAASISLSLSRILPSYFFTPPTVFLSHSQASRNNIKIPCQVSCISHLSIFKKPFFKSTISSNPLQTPLSIVPRRPSDPSSSFGLRRASIVWFRKDLRVHDNEALTSANNESVSVLPVFCFNKKDFDKTGTCKASFLIEAVSDLRKNLQSRGSDLVVRIGKPEKVLAELAKAVGADAVYAHREVSQNEVKAEEEIEVAMKEEGVEVKYFWGSTLYHLDDLPFKMEEMPTNHGDFKEKVEGLEVRKTIVALDQLRGLPSRGDVEAGDVPSLADLGLNPSATLGQFGKPVANAPAMGGETEALQRLKTFASEFRAQPNFKKGNNSIYGASFSCKIAPWLATGCLSPRMMSDELKKSVSMISSDFKPKDGVNGGSETGMNWFTNELLWRDFFRFITKKYSAARQRSAPLVAA